MHGRLTTLDGADGVFASLDRRLLTADPAPVAVAVSGGGDSLALLILASRWAEAAGRPLLALTVDHRLHPNSAGWTAFAADCAARRGAAFRALEWEGDKPRHGVPEAARRARHALLAEAARRAGAGVILVGHTADDVDETERMRAGDAPGIGRIRAWAPSPAWPQGRGVMLLRPMLGVRRAALRAWLLRTDEAWIDDPANEDARFARVRARRSAAPPPPAAPMDEAAVVRLAREAATLDDASLVLDRAVLLAAPAEAARHVLSVAAVCVGGGSTPPRRTQVGRVLDHIRRPEPPAIQLAGARIEVEAGRLTITREPGDQRRNPRPEVDGVTDGRFEGKRRLVGDRFRAATFQVADEAGLRTSAWP